MTSIEKELDAPAENGPSNVKVTTPPVSAHVMPDGAVQPSYWTPVGSGIVTTVSIAASCAPLAAT